MKTPRHLDDESTKHLNYNFLLFPLFAVAFSQLLSFFLSSYFQIRLTETLIFKADDGWCNTESQGIGNHCFGDFSAFMTSKMDDPWSNSNTAYPPFSIIFFSLFKFIYSLSNESNLALFSYLFLLQLSCILPVFYFVRCGISKLQATVLSVFFLLLAPALMVIDRGNNIGFSVPLIFYAYIFAIQKKYSHFQFAVLILTLLKPQFALLSLFLLVINQKRLFTIYFFNTTIAYSLSFLLFGPRDFLKNIFNWFLNLFYYQSYVDMPTVFPTNISFSNLVSLFFFLAGKANVAFGELLTKVTSNPKVFTFTSLFFLSLFMVALFLRRRSMNEIQVLTAILIVIIMTPTVSFAYYLAVLLPFIYLLFFSLLREFTSNPRGRFLIVDEIFLQFNSIFNTRLKRVTFYGFFSTTFVNWPIPWRFLGVSETNLTSILSFVWIFSSVFLFLFLWLLVFSNSKRLNGVVSDELHFPKSETNQI